MVSNISCELTAFAKLVRGFYEKTLLCGSTLFIWASALVIRLKLQEVLLSSRLCPFKVRLHF